MNEKGFDGFEDVLQGNLGIYGQDTAGLAHALVDHDRREVTATPAGLQVKFSHDPCGQTMIAVVEWPDVVALAHNIPPRVAYATRINPQQPSLVEKYPNFAANLGHWIQKGHGGPWALQGLRCGNTGCPKRDMALLVSPEDVVENVRVASAQRWIKDEQALKNWTRAAVQMHMAAAR